MRLEGLYKNFGTSTPEEQAEYVAAYRAKRAADLVLAPAPARKKSSSPKPAGSKIDLSDAEKALMKSLGLKPKAILALRAVQTPESSEEEDETGAELFQDGTFSEE